ncbi:MAG: MFS transporter, partial [Gammaproteobacteria bacterium]|nr:MFS transporter [Gammaproteobacteria bacterium]
PVFQERVFDVDPRGLGIMYTATGVGALGGSLLVASLSEHPALDRFQLLTGIGFGLTLAGFAWSPTFEVGVLLLVFVGGTSMAFFALNNALVMQAS